MKRLKKLAGIFLIFSMIVGVSCTAAAAVKLDQKKITTGVGETERLWLNGASDNVKWSSSNPKVAKIVRPNGNTTEITAKKAGTAVIRARYNKKTYSCKIVCKKIALNASSVTLKKGKSKTLKLKYAKLTKSHMITWRTDNTSVLSITATSGNKVTVRARGAGKAKLTATYRGKKYKCVFTVPGSSGSGSSESGATSTSLLSVSSATVKLSVGSSKTVDIQYKALGDLSYRYPDASKLSASMGSWNQSKEAFPLTITGKSAGETTITIKKA